MKKYLILFSLLSIFILSCNKNPDEPDLIRAYCYLYHFIPQMESVIWEADGIELPDPQDYAYDFPGAIILEAAAEEIEFTVKQPGTKEVLASGLFQLEQNKFYNIIACGPAQEPVLLFSKIETSYPATGNVQMQVLHSVPGQGPIDFYMGDTIPDKKVITAMEYLQLTDPLEVSETDARLEMTVTAHGEVFNQDSVLLASNFNEIISGANYLTIVAPSTHDTASELTFWMYVLPYQ